MTNSDAESVPEVEEQIDDLDEASEVIPFTYLITAYGADYPVDSIVKRIDAEDIVVPRFSWNGGVNNEIAGFQREYVWPRPKADRFVESLLLGLPVPGIFLVKEQSGRLLVLDGHQRLYTLQAFYQGVINGQEYRLSNVQERFSGKRYKDLDTEDRRRLDDSIIHATVVRQDEPTEDQSSIYVIFERLNTGGVNLQPQEIRVALYHGALVGVMRDLNEFSAWRSLYGSRSRRLKDMEMILRFFAFYYHAQAYRRPMKDFLNRYMASNRNLQKQDEQELKATFQTVSSFIRDVVGHGAFRPVRTINAAVIDSILVGAARRLAKGSINDHAMFRTKYEELLRHKEYRAAIETGTSQETNVENRLRLATEAFESVK